MTWSELLALIQYFKHSPFHTENRLNTDETIRNSLKSFADELVKRMAIEKNEITMNYRITEIINELLTEAGVER